jgi:predicted GIY-YIG superfamily endonuclease
MTALGETMTALTATVASYIRLPVMDRTADYTFDLWDVIQPGRNYFGKTVDRILRRGNARICVYVVRVGEWILYVGMTSQFVTNRLKGHMGSNSTLGKYIKQWKPMSHKWSVDVYVMPDRKTAYQIEAEMQGILNPEF